MTSKRRSLSKFTSGVSKRRKNPNGNGEGGSSSGGSKSGIWDETVAIATDLVLPGVAAYAGTRIAGRIGHAIGRRKSATAAKHMVPLSSLAMAISAIILAGKWDKLERYRTGIMVGSGIAAIQAILQAYVPMWAWVLSDPNEDAVRAMLAQPVLPEHLLEPGYIEQLPGSDLGPGAGYQQQVPQQGQEPQQGGIDVDDFSDIPGMDGSLKTGIFS